MTPICIDCESEVTYHAGTSLCKACAADFYAEENTENNAVDTEEDTQ